jgi:hypothetical protein
LIENTVLLTRVVGTKRAGNRKMERMINQELHHLYSTPDIIKEMKPRAMRWGKVYGRIDI